MASPGTDQTAADRAIVRVVELVAAGANPTAVEAAVIEEALRLTGADHVLIVRPDGDGDDDAQLAHAAVMSGRTTAEPGDHGPIAMAAPLGPDSEEVTAIVARAGRGAALTADGSDALGRLALVAGVGIAGARAVERAFALVASGLAIGSGLDLDQVLQRVLEAARRIIGARYAALGVLSEDRHTLARFLWSGIDDMTAMNIGQLPSGKGLLGRLISDPRPLRAENMAEHPDSSGFPPGHPPMRSFLGVPVSLDGQVFGNLYLTDRVGGPFTAEDERTATILAAQAAVAIANARAAADERRCLTESAQITASREREAAAADGHRRAIRAQEAERMRVARELHDETGQVLTAVALELRALEEHVDDEGQGRLAAARRTLASASTKLGDLATRLRPSGLREHGLANALEREAERLRDDAGITVDVSLTGLPTNLSDEVEIAVFRVVQEALTNIQRHARARNASVLVRQIGERVRLIVEDDGVGFDPSAETDRLGLAGIRERVALVGGDVEIESVPGSGTAVVVEIPVVGYAGDTVP